VFPFWTCDDPVVGAVWLVLTGLAGGIGGFVGWKIAAWVSMRDWFGGDDNGGDS